MADPVPASVTPASPAPAPVAAPASAVETVKVSATDAAVKTGKTQDYRAAKRAERFGTALPDVEVPASDDGGDDADPGDEQPPATSATGAPLLSKRQQRIQDQIRKGVEEGTAAIRRELDEFKARTPPPASAAVTPKADEKPAAPKPPAWREFLSLPDAPKLDAVNADGTPVFASLEEHSAAMALFILEKQADRTAKTTAAESSRAELTTAQQQRVEKFQTRLKEAATADPEFLKKLTPKVRDLRPTIALLPGESAGPLHLLTDQIHTSPVAPQILLHLAQHPEAFDRFEAMPDDVKALPAGMRIRAHIEHIVREFGKLEAKFETDATAAPVADEDESEPRHISRAPAPPRTLGSRPTEPSDPMEQAIKSPKTSAYRTLRRAQRASKLGLRA